MQKKVIKVLVVEDSLFFQRQLVKLINSNPEFEVVAIANNGLEAIEKLKETKPDIITMDVQMPIMDGITATKKILEVSPKPILILSSINFQAARSTFDALADGAVDFMLKTKELFSPSEDTGKVMLFEKLKSIAACKIYTFGKATAPSFRRLTDAKKYKDLELIIIGASTGGPMTVQHIISDLPANYRVPILIVIHMPDKFTTAFAERMNGLTDNRVVEVSNGDVLASGKIMIAPGGKQLELNRSLGVTRCKLQDAKPNQNYKPCIDITLNSAAELYGKNMLAIILTGMGNDGTEGVRSLKNKGGFVWAQDEASSIVFGMPQAVISSKLCDNVFSVMEIRDALRELNHGYT